MSTGGSSASDSGNTTLERRTQRRIQVEIPVTLVVRGLAQPLTAAAKDVSWGGILLDLAQPLPPGTGTVRIILPWKREERITLLAQVLRAKRLQDGHYLTAARFLSLSPRSHARLERLLATLNATGTHPETGPSEMVKELEVSVNDLEELRRIMESIASGRHTLIVFEAYAVNQSLCLVLTGTEEWTGMRLRARVVEVKPTTMPGFAGVHLYAVTLQFEHPRESLANVIHYILGQLPDPSDASVLLDWSQMAPSQFVHHHVHAAPPAPRDERPITSTLRCALEMDFPEALNYLTLGWGDSQAFEMLFRELTLGERFHSGGWPPDAWEELILLQDVHDRAYGLAGERDIFRKFGDG